MIHTYTPPTLAASRTVQVVGTTCPQGYECFPIDYGEPCGQGQCRPCSYGMYCPAGTANPYSTYQHNACPAGKNCPAASVDAGNATSVTNPEVRDIGDGLVDDGAAHALRVRPRGASNSYALSQEDFLCAHCSMH